MLTDGDAASASVVAAVVPHLEARSMFMSYGGDEEVDYLVGPDAVEALAWLLTSIVVPIMVNLVSDKIAARAEERRASLEGGPELDGAYLATVRVEVREMLSKPVVADPRALDRATEAACEVLLARGWPRECACEDARKIVADVMGALGVDASAS